MSMLTGNFCLNDFLPLIFCALALPVASFIWFGNIALFGATQSENFDDEKTCSPLRWFFSIFGPLILMVIAIKRKGVNKSGAILGLIVAIVLSIANQAFFASLATFFFTSSLATRFRGEMKKKHENNFKEGDGQRNWIQVVCNCGMATQYALLYLLDCGSGERLIDFVHQYRSSWLSVGILSCFACCNGDTWASELGTVLSQGDPFLITTRQKVPRGTNGAISWIGCILSFAGGLVVGISYYITIIVLTDSSYIIKSPQWPIIIYGGFAGFVGSIFDSLLGATLQFSGITKDGKIVEIPGKNITHLSGFKVLDNHSVNLISSILIGIVMPQIAFRFWPETL